MIFPVLKTEDIVQVDDKTRFSADKSFVSKGSAAITLIEIEPDTGEGFFDVTTHMCLDWQYDTAGDKTVTLRITTDGAPVTKSKTVTIISEADDRLFSSDEELQSHEDCILDYVRKGRHSYLDKHRLTQEMIIRWINDQRLCKKDGSALDKTDLVSIEEVREWSKFYTLFLIYNSLSNSSDDVFSQKATFYFELSKNAQNRSFLRLDTNDDGIADSKPDLRTARLVRR